MPDSTKIGDRIHVVYEASNPSSVQDLRVLHRGPWLVVLIGASGLFFLWLTRKIYRMDPEAPGWGRKHPR